METIDCIFCGISSEWVVIQENGYTGRKCPNCHLIYISPRPDQAVLQAMYETDVTRISAKDLIETGFVQRLFAKHHLRRIKRFVKSGSLLEIGAGAGYFLSEARSAGFTVSGIELNHTEANFMRTVLNIDCEETPFNTASFDGRQFDVIYLCNVLGHLYDPLSEFSMISSRLVDNGWLIFETGNLGDVASRYFSLYESLDYPEHLFFMSEANIRELVWRSGLELVQIYRYSLLPQLLIAKLRRNLRKTRSVSSTSVASPNSITAEQSEQEMFSYASGKTRFSLRHLFSYLVRYEMGALVPKKGRPQTVLVIARKRA